MPKVKPPKDQVAEHDLTACICELCVFFAEDPTCEGFGDCQGVSDGEFEKAYIEAGLGAFTVAADFGCVLFEVREEA